MIIGNTLGRRASRRRGRWVHSVQDAAAMVRDFIKWDDIPVSLQHFAESAVRAYKIAMTPPMMPVLLVADTELQESRSPPSAEGCAFRSCTLNRRRRKAIPAPSPKRRSMLVAAENPVIVADRAARTPDGPEAAGGAGRDSASAGRSISTGRMNFPTRHPLNQSQSNVAAALMPMLVVHGLECMDFWALVNRDF